MNEQQLRDQIQIVIEARKLNEELTQARGESYSRWLLEHKQLLDNGKLAQESLIAAETHLRAMTLEAYLETGNKTPALGVGIRIVTKLDYRPETAFKWAQNHKMALKLDILAFEKIVKAAPSELKFVTIREEPQATIATNLEEDKE